MKARKDKKTKGTTVTRSIKGKSAQKKQNTAVKKAGKVSENTRKKRLSVSGERVKIQSVKKKPSSVLSGNKKMEPVSFEQIEAMGISGASSGKQNDIILQNLSDRFDYPLHYGQNYITLMIRDPNWIFAYWGITDQTVENLKLSHAVTDYSKIKLILKVFDVTKGDYQHPNSVQDFFPAYGSTSYYINAKNETAYLCEIGFLTDKGEYILVARSNTVETPSNQFSSNIDDTWITLENFHKIFAVPRPTLTVHPPSPRPGSPVTGPHPMMPSSGAVSSGVFSGEVSSFGMSSGLVSSAVLSSETLSSWSMSSAALSSGALSSWTLETILSSFGLSSAVISSYAVSSEVLSLFGFFSGAISSGMLSSFGLSSAALSSGILSSWGLSSFAWTLSIPLSSWSGLLSSGALSSAALSSYFLSSGALALSSMSLSSWTLSSFLSSFGLSSAMLSSYALSSAGFSSQMNALFSGVLSSFNLPSSGIFSSSELQKRQDPPLFLDLNTEVVVYGKTVSDAQLTIHGMSKKVNHDGTFTARFVLPEGSHPIQVETATSHGKISKKSTLNKASD
ncbi:MAG: DUF4912 domain-containing protein [Candidatus Aureabacteria bacterium]|nr:DUF4912 domain-containing protein [Candidatus Auribacterota bacterium]